MVSGSSSGSTIPNSSRKNRHGAIRISKSLVEMRSRTTNAPLARAASRDGNHETCS
jgi:hypothetical protein